MYPTQKIKMPKDLAGHKNGQLPDELLGPVPGGKLHTCAVRSYKHMLNAAKADGITLKPTSTVDTYRPYSVQYNAFMQRYSPKPTDDTRGITRTFEGATWYLKKGMAPCAAPVVQLWRVRQVVVSWFLPSVGIKKNLSGVLEVCRAFWL